MFQKLALVLFVTLSSAAWAKANYSLACSMKGTVAHVYACNSGNSSEGNNHYVSVTACDGSDCDNDYDLMYIYASSGQCDPVGSIDFGETKEFCTAIFRP
jgi:hypothetical protein